MWRISPRHANFIEGGGEKLSYLLTSAHVKFLILFYPSFPGRDSDSTPTSETIWWSERRTPVAVRYAVSSGTSSHLELQIPTTTAPPSGVDASVRHREVKFSHRHNLQWSERITLFWYLIYRGCIYYETLYKSRSCGLVSYFCLLGESEVMLWPPIVSFAN